MPSAFQSPLVIRALSPAEVAAAGSAVALYQLLEDLVYDSAAFGRIVAPAGLVTDFASIPRAALWFIRDDSPAILFGSVIHDCLYTAKGQLPGGRVLTRAECDGVLAEAMAVCGASALQRNIVHRAVSLFGGSHW